MITACASSLLLVQLKSADNSSLPYCSRLTKMAVLTMSFTLAARNDMLGSCRGELELLTNLLSDRGDH
jgi:hypothetical protein